MQLLEREAKRKYALGVTARQRARQSLVAKRRDFGRISRKRCFKPIERLRRAPGYERACTRVHEIACARTDGREKWTKTAREDIR